MSPKVGLKSGLLGVKVAYEVVTWEFNPLSDAFRDIDNNQV